MKAASSTPQPAYENPLMPNAKLRQMYTGVLRARMLAARLPQPKRPASTVGLEACLVAPAVDLTSADLVLDAFPASPAVDFLRGKPAELALNPARRLRAAGTLADAGAPTCISAPPTGAERIWTAIGAAAALKASAHGSSSGLQPAVDDAAGKRGFSLGASHNSAETARDKDSPVLVCYMRPDDLQPAAWTKALTHVSAHKLPILIVVLPAAQPQGSRTGQLATLAIRNRIPGMPVDQDDAVAIYRVAQEAIGHARIGGGGALIECVRYTVEGQRTPASDCITTLANYLLERKVAEPRWLESQAKLFARRIGLQLVKSR